MKRELYYSQKKDLLVYKRDILINKIDKEEYVKLVTNLYRSLDKELSKYGLNLKITQMKNNRGLSKVSVIISSPVYFLEKKDFDFCDVLDIVNNMSKVELMVKKYFIYE